MAGKRAPRLSALREGDSRDEIGTNSPGVHRTHSYESPCRRACLVSPRLDSAPGARLPMSIPTGRNMQTQRSLPSVRMPAEAPSILRVSGFPANNDQVTAAVSRPGCNGGPTTLCTAWARYRNTEYENTRRQIFCQDNEEEGEVNTYCHVSTGKHARADIQPSGN